MLDALVPERVSPTVLALVSEDAPNRKIICAGGGSFEQANVTLTAGLFIEDRPDAAEQLLAGHDRLADRSGEIIPANATAQGQVELAKGGFDLAAML